MTVFDIDTCRGMQIHIVNVAKSERPSADIELLIAPPTLLARLDMCPRKKIRMLCGLRLFCLLNRFD